MTDRYNKTSEGRRETQIHERALSRARRNLLLVINDSQGVDYWLSNVKGVTQTDVEWLKSEGLIALVRLEMAASSDDPTWHEALRLIEKAPFAVLTEVLKAQAWALLKGVRAYRFVQEVDVCVDDAELRDMARAFLGAILGECGRVGVRSFREALNRRLTNGSTSRWSEDVADTGWRSLSMPATSFASQDVAGSKVDRVAKGTIEFDASACYRLTRWPSATLLSSPQARRLASLISARALPLAQVALLGHVDVAVALGFVQSMHDHGLLAIERVSAQSAGSPARMTVQPGMMPPSQPNRASASPAVPPGLLGRLRERLGLR